MYKKKIIQRRVDIYPQASGHVRYSNIYPIKVFESLGRFTSYVKSVFIIQTEMMGSFLYSIGIRIEKQVTSSLRFSIISFPFQPKIWCKGIVGNVPLHELVKSKVNMKEVGDRHIIVYDLFEL